MARAQLGTLKALTSTNPMVPLNLSDPFVLLKYLRAIAEQLAVLEAKIEELESGE